MLYTPINTVHNVIGGISIRSLRFLIAQIVADHFEFINTSLKYRLFIKVNTAEAATMFTYNFIAVRNPARKQMGTRYFG